MQMREIDLLDMMTDILSYWRSLVVVLLTGAVLLGALSYVNSYREIQNIQSQRENKQDQTLLPEQLEQALDDSKRLTVLATLNDRKEYEIKKKYFENSVYMQLDPLQVAQTELVYRMQTADADQDTQNIISYELLLDNVGLYEWVSGQTGIDASSVEELIIVESAPRVKTQEEIWKSASVTDSNSLKVTILGKDADSCRQLTDAVKSYISDATDLALVLISETSGIMINKEIMSEQAKCADELTSLQTAIAKAKGEFTEEQKQYYDLQSGKAIESEQSVQDPATEEIATISPTVSKKYVALGAVLFAVVYVMILAMGYIFNTKVRVSDELQQIYDIPQIGLIVKDSGKKLFLDRWIDSLRHYGKREFTAEQSMELAFAAVKITAVKNGLSSICLMGCNMSAGAGKVCESLRVALEKEQIRVTVLDNVLYDAEAMEKVDAMQGAVLVEKAGSTLYSEINNELALLKRQEIPVLGGIIVE